MKPQDMKIGKRLALNFSAILLLVVLLGAIMYVFSNQLWQNTKTLYDHPLIVSKASRDIKANIIAMHRTMKDLVLCKTPAEIQAAISTFNKYETEIYLSFDILYEWYLGNKEDINNAFKDFKAWKVITDETIRLLQSGQQEEAAQRTMSSGVGGVHVDLMLQQIQFIIDYSNNKADSLYHSAQKKRDAIYLDLSILIGVILFLSVLIAIKLIKSIRTPLEDLTNITEQYRQGDYKIRSGYIATNEIGILADTFNKMASTVQSEIHTKENIGWVAHWLMKENELEPFCKNLLNILLKKTGAQIAAIYLLGPEKLLFEHYESIGLSPEKIKPFSARVKEGEFGAALAEKNIIHLKNIPENTSFTFSAVTGTFIPKEIITIPIIDQDEVTALISLASLQPFNPLTLRLINDIWITLTARLNGVIAFQKIHDFSILLNEQNKELEAQSKELTVQTNELNENNIELEMQKKELDKANQLKSSFLSNMSHELRTPLNSVIALSEVLSTRLEGHIAEEEFNYLGIIERNGKQLLSIINDILDLSRLEAGKEELIFSRLSISDLVDDILYMMEIMIREKGIKVVNKLSPEDTEIISDNRKCRHILQNIIGNAVKFTEQGSIEISAVSENDQMHIYVTDTGIGIHPDHLPFIFDEFRQVDERSSRKYEGTGLGLAIAKKYSLLIGGSIDVKSRPDSGSTFIFKVPLKPDDNHLIVSGREIFSTGNKSVVHSSAFNEKDKKTILIVEDSQAQIIQLTDILEKDGYNVRVAHDGKEALETIKYMIPDAVILDLKMPDVDGFEVLKTIRSIKETRKIPVLILTSKHISNEELSFLKGNNIYQLIQKGSAGRKELLTIIYNMVYS